MAKDKGKKKEEEAPKEAPKEEAPKEAPKKEKRTVKFKFLPNPEGDGTYGDHKIKKGILEVPPAVASEIIRNKDPRFKKIK